MQQILGHLPLASARKLAKTQHQYRGQFPPTNDILFTLSQAELFEDFGVPISRHHISTTGHKQEQKDDTNDVVKGAKISGGRGGERGAAAIHLLRGKLWNQHSNVPNCDFDSDMSCKWLIPYYYAEGSNTQVRTHISSAMANIERKTCLKFQYLTNPGHPAYTNKKKLKVVTNANICASYVGSHYINQEIYLSQEPEDLCGVHDTTVEHVILHCLGLFHENQR